MRPAAGTKLKIATVLAACLGLFACTQYYIGDRIFDTKDEALAWVDAEMQKEVMKVEPRGPSLRGAVVLIVPDENRLRAVVRKDYPNEPEESIDLWVKTQIIMVASLGDAIRRRNTFNTVRVVNASTPEGVAVPPDGYLLWYEQCNSDDGFFHILATGEAETTQLIREPPSKEERGFQRLVEEIEDYVLSHPPSR